MTENRDWTIYRLINKSKEEVFHSISNNAEHEIEILCKKDQIKEILHWQWNKDEIIIRDCISSHMDQEEALVAVKHLHKDYRHIEGFSNLTNI